VSSAAQIEIAALTRPRPRFVPAFLALFLLGSQLYLIATRDFAHLLENPFLPYCLLGAFAIHMAARPGRGECLITLTLASLLGLGFAVLRPGFQWTWPNELAVASSLGVATLAVLSFHTARLRGVEQRERMKTLIAGSVFIYTALFIAFVLKLTAALHPKTYDLYLYAADTGFGIPIAAQVALFLARHSVLSSICEFVYESLPLAVSLLYAYEKGGRRPLVTRVLPAFLGGGAAAYLLYNFMPAAGPLYVFGAQFPQHLPKTVPLALEAPLIAGAPRNAVPSMHLACALLIFWNARRLAHSAYLASALYLGFTVMATLGFGEHYVVDLVAGVPYALFLGAACANKSSQNTPEQRRAMVTGLALTLAWMLTLRFAPLVFRWPVLTWPAVAATIATCWIAQRQFEGVRENAPIQDAETQATRT
jgi:hypothetical protein